MGTPVEILGGRGARRGKRQPRHARPLTLRRVFHLAFLARTNVASSVGCGRERQLGREHAGRVNGAGVDVAIEAVGIPATFDICQSILAAGGRLANVGVHGKPVQLHLETLWDRNIAITTRLVDTAAIPLLLRLVESGQPKPASLVTHRFALADMMNAYDTFAYAAHERALKVILTN